MNQKQYVVQLDQATSSHPQSEITSAKTILDANLNQLHAVIEDLTKRLGPVLRYDREQTNGLGPQPVDVKESEMANSIMASAGHADELIQKLTNVLHRLAI
jgi:hypothetical protein